MSAKLTERQQAAFTFIRDYIQQNERPPSYMEIGRALGIRSTNGVSRLLDALERKGVIEREPGMARSIRIAVTDSAPPEEDLKWVPVLRRVPLDQPDALLEHPRGYLVIDPSVLDPNNPEAKFGIAQIADDGMSDRGVYRQDLVVVQLDPTYELLRSSNIAKTLEYVVLTEDGFVLREVAFVQGSVQLLPRSRNFSTKVVELGADSCIFVGPAVLLMRRVQPTTVQP